MSPEAPFRKMPKELRTEAAARLRAYLAEELDAEVGTLAAELLLDFAAALAGPVYYNMGLDDARAVLAARAGDIDEELLALQRPLDAPGGRRAP